MNPRPKDKWIIEEKSNAVIPVSEYRINKFGNTKKKARISSTKQTYNGNKYDSKFEAQVAENLDWMLKSGQLVSVDRQVKVPLYVNGVLICNYYLDFKTVDKNGQVNYIEVKGFETQLWILKKKMFIALLPTIDRGATYEIIKQ